MYDSFASIQDDDHHGTTRLHTDICEAVNYLMWSHGSFQDGRYPPGAEWVIIHRDDTDAVIHFLRDVNPFVSVDISPIHSQRYFLTPSHLRELRARGIRAYTITQRVGDAIFIPAGCAHQVRSFDTKQFIN